MSGARAGSSRVGFFGLLALLAIGLSARGAEPAIPSGYELVERTRSPDGRYGVLFPRKSGASDDYPPNLLVRLAPYKVLAEIRPGLPDGVTTDLATTWNGNRTVAIHHFRRWGLVGLWVYDLDGDRVVKRQDALTPAREILRADFRSRLSAKYPKEPEVIIFVSAEGEEDPAPVYRFDGRRLRLKLFADNKPNLAGGPHWSADLEATWDLDKGKFTKVKLTPGPVEMRPQM